MLLGEVKELSSLRCNTCVFLKQGFCSKIGEDIPSRLAKLFFGGAVDLLSGTLTYASECGIEKAPMPETGSDIEFFIAQLSDEEVCSAELGDEYEEC
jgi:hypothetical protein